MLNAHRKTEFLYKAMQNKTLPYMLLTIQQIVNDLLKYRCIYVYDFRVFFFPLTFIHGRSLIF